MSENGQVTQKEFTEEMIPDFAKSVKKDDYAQGTMQFMIPAYGYWGRKYKSTPLPHQLPDWNRFTFYTNRDWTLLSTPDHESLWANTIAVATTKAAVWGYDLEGMVALRRKRAQALFQNATAGVFTGWVSFIYAHIRSFLLTGKAVVEIEREQKGPMSKITGLHHLNPLRCRITDNPKYPVEYLDRRGQTHRLAAWQVMLFGDQVDPTEGELEMVESAAQRAYQHIARMEAVDRYLYEKVTGVRATSIEFIQGITARALQDALQSADHDMERRGAMIYKGVVAVPIPGDIPVQRISIPLAEIPDGFDYQNIHDNAVIVYAGATGMDVNDIDPRLAQRGGLGSAGQALMLDMKAKGKGMVAWRRDWQMKVNALVLDATTKFTWSEQTLDDELKKAQVQNTRAGVAKIYLETQLVTADQARNLLVDAGDLPREFLTESEPGGGKLEDEDKPTEQTPEAPTKPDESAQNGQNPPQKPTDAPKSAESGAEGPKSGANANGAGNQAKKTKERTGGEFGGSKAKSLVLSEMPIAAHTALNIALKHQSGNHPQDRHGWRFGGDQPLSKLRSQRQNQGEAEWDEFKRRVRGGERRPLPKGEDKPTQPAKPAVPTGNFKNYDDPAEAIKKARSDSAAFYEMLSRSEADALGLYTGNGYASINALAREGADALTSPEWVTTAKNATRYIDSSLNKNRLDSDTVLHRGVFSQSLADKLMETGQGGVWADPAFLSTSLNGERIDVFADPSATGKKPGRIYMKIQAPKGTRVAPMADFALVASEAEYILPRNTPMYINQIEQRNGATYVTMTVLPQP